MSPVTHFLTGWVIANSDRLDRRDRALVTLACVAPDIDGLGIIAEVLTRDSTHPLEWFSLYHHRLHTLFFSLIVASFSWILANQKWKTAILTLLSFHVHLLEDVAGSRGPDGYQWPIRYLYPFSDRMQFSWNGQWSLNAWQNVAITIALLILTFWLAWRRGVSPLDMISMNADSVFVASLRRRFTKPSNRSFR
jgi:inner membrane protein